jgi:maleylpyruvate isomerase
MTTEAPDQRLQPSLGWMDRGTEFFVTELARLSDDELSDPSRLPGWTRLHVVSHMARNARALMNLLRWAESGVESPMYPTPEHRRADIEAGAQLPAAEVRADALFEARRFREAISALPADAWAAQVRTALGRPISASEVPWMRVREVWVHGVDLAAKATFSDIDDDVAAALLDEAAARLNGRDDCPSAVLVTTGANESRHVIGPTAQEPLEARGSAQALAGWLLGRTAGAGVECSVPLRDLPPWL